jgi:hypothetical protein
MPGRVRTLAAHGPWHPPHDNSGCPLQVADPSLYRFTNPETVYIGLAQDSYRRDTVL